MNKDSDLTYEGEAPFELTTHELSNKEGDLTYESIADDINSIVSALMDKAEKDMKKYKVLPNGLIVLREEKD